MIFIPVVQVWNAFLSCCWCGWCAWVYLWCVTLGILKINPIFIHSNCKMQKRIPFVPSEQNVTCVFALFNLSVVQLMWFQSIGLLNLSHLSWSIENSSLINAQLFGKLFLCLWIIFAKQCFQFHIFTFFGSSPCSLSATSKLPLLKRRNHRSHVSWDGACPSSTFRSNRYDSAEVFFKWKQKKIVRECSLFGINFDILNTTIQHYAYTFPIYHLCLFDTCLSHNKMAQCQIFAAQTALLHHLLSEIRISYLYPPNYTQVITTKQKCGYTYTISSIIFSQQDVFRCSSQPF